MEKIHQCQLCTKSYERKSGFSRHLSKVHGIKSDNSYKPKYKTAECVCECGTKFDTWQGLMGHFSWCVIHKEMIGKLAIKRDSPNKGQVSPHRGKKIDEYVKDAEATKLKLSISAKAAAQSNPYTHSDKIKEELSLHRIKILETSPHVKWQTIGNIKVQGTWEFQVAEKCFNAGLKIERKRIKFDSHRHYTPDLYLPDLDIYIEVKGWLSDRDKAKYRKVMLEHSDKDIRIIHGKKELKRFNPEDILKLDFLRDKIN